jgi:hypothetical protein
MYKRTQIKTNIVIDVDVRKTLSNVKLAPCDIVVRHGILYILSVFFKPENNKKDQIHLEEIYNFMYVK